MGWEPYTPPGKFPEGPLTQSKMAQAVSFSPEEEADQARQEYQSKDIDIAKIKTELAKNKNPKVQAILEAELANRQALTPPDGSWEPYTGPQEGGKSDAGEWEPYSEGPTPNLASSALQGAISAAGGLYKTGAHIVGGLADLASTGAGDPIFEHGDTVGKAADELILSQEEQARGNLANKVAAGVGGVVPYLAGGAAGLAGRGVAGLMGTVGAIGGTERGLEQGMSGGQAAATGAMEGALGVAQGFLPALGSTVVRSGLLNAGVNSLGGGLSDAVISNVILNSDQAKIKAQYNPLDFDKRFVEAATGGILGAGLKKFEVWDQDRTNTKRTERIQTLVGDVDKALSSQLSTYEKPVIGPNQTPKDVLLEKLQSHDQGNQRDVAYLISIDPEARPSQKALAEALFVLSDSLGTDSVPIWFDPLANGKSSYFADKDAIGLSMGHLAEISKGNYQPLLHEMVHAGTVGAINFYEYNKGANEKLLTPVQKNIFRRAAELEAVYNTTFDRLLKENALSYGTKSWEHVDKDTGVVEPRHGIFDIANMQSYLDSIKGNRTHPDREFFFEHYGMRNLKEFASEVLTNPKFQAKLAGMKLSQEDLIGLRGKGTRAFPNMFVAFKETLKNLLRSTEGKMDNNLLGVALDSVFGMMESPSPAQRALYREPSDYSPEIMRAHEKATQQEAAKSNSPMVQYLLQRMQFLRKVSNSKAEFANRVKLEIPTSEWNDVLSKHIDNLWQQPYHLEELAGKTTPESDAILRRWGRTDPDIDNFMRTEMQGMINKDGVPIRSFKPFEDIKPLGTNFLTSNAIRLWKSGTPAGMVLKWVHDRVSEYRLIKDLIYEQAKQRLSDFSNLPKEGRNELLKTILEYQTGAGTRILKDQGLSWLSDDMLRQHGMDDAQIKAYHGMTDAAEYMYSVIDQARLKMGLPPLEKVPGYMPHVWKGAYKVVVVRKPKDGSQEKVVYVAGFNNKWSAKNYIDRLKSGKFDDPDATYGVERDRNTNEEFHVLKHEDISNAMSSVINEHLTAYQNQLLLDPHTLQAIQQIENDAMRGWSKHLLERSWVGGWIGEVNSENAKFAPKEKTERQINKEVDELATVYQNYARQVSEFYGNVLFMDEVISPLLDSLPNHASNRQFYGIMLKDAVNLQDAIRRFAFNFAGENINHLKFIDKAIQDAGVFVGVDPLSYRRLVRESKNWLSTLQLKVNPGNYVANAMQPISVGMNLNMFNTMYANETGKKAPSVMVSMAKGMQAMVTGKLDKYQRMAMDYAENSHNINPQLAAELKVNTKIHSFINGEDAQGRDVWKNPLSWNKAIESFGRKTSYLIAYEHFRKVYGDGQKAMDAALNAMEMTMVNYDRSERPLMYQNFGVAGEAISPFAVFRNAYLGNTMIAMHYAITNKGKNKTWMPLAAMALTYGSMAGALGMIGISEWEALVKLWNTNVPSYHFPTPSELAMSVGLPNWAMYGAVGAVTGSNVGASMNAPGFDDAVSAALPTFLTNLAKATIDLFNPNSTVSDRKGALHGVAPAAVKPWIERWAMDTPNIKPKATSTEGMVGRTNDQFGIEAFWGKPAIPVARELAATYVDVQTEKQNNEVAKKMVKIGVDALQGKKDDEKLSQAFKVWNDITGKSWDEYSKAVKDAMEGKYTTYTDRLAKDAMGSPSNAQRLEQIYKMGGR